MIWRGGESMADKKVWNEPVIEILSVSDSTNGGGIVVVDGASLGNS